ncbi:hypothetical protein [Nonomuraea sp. NPDC049141]|uniref:hypothetical protein n=1 Tax=Nonomuraea sp. NPDC049141 TaxID=3155500 RepID=UPI003411D72E
MPKLIVTVTENVTYDFEIDVDDLLEELIEDSEVPLVLNFGNPDVLAEWLDVDSDLIANGCCDENFSGCEDREIIDVVRVDRPYRKPVIQGHVITQDAPALEAAGVR